MTVLEQKVLDIIEQYGLKRRCRCYHMDCIVLPGTLNKKLVERLIKEIVQLTGGKQ